MDHSGSTQVIQDLLQNQKLAVLSTNDSGQPYCSLIALAETGDNRSIIFVTNRNTRKYRNLIKNNRVSILIDNRSNRETDFLDAVAITLTGQAQEINRENSTFHRNLFLGKHPGLTDFFDNPDNSIFIVDIDDYVVASFKTAFKTKI